MLNELETRLKRLFSTTGGKALLQCLEREAAQTEEAVEARRAAAARIEDARRRDREETPALEAAVEETAVAQRAAREALRRASRSRYEAGTRLSRHRDHVRDEVRRGEAELRRTADPRLRDSLDRLHAASANFHHVANRLLRLELRGQFMKAHYVAVNRAEVEALEDRLHAALAEVRGWLLVPDPAEEDLLRVLAEADAVLDAATLPEGGGR